CELNFEETYGNMGYKFIHVHHLTPVSTVGKEYKVNPVEDLRPVCPNCHAMLHRRNPPLTIEELREIIEECSDESED
ncbi:MAG TPA: HNH endonuclease, partial [Flavobacterium sp.]|nr:HNH endonuclease [Flavobacterium sp.]